MKSRDYWHIKDAMKDMTWRERIDYIWTYYNVHIIITVSVVALVVAFLSAVLAPQKQVVFGGTTVNVTLSEEGKQYLTQQLFAPMGGTDPAKQEIFCQESTLGQTDYGDTTGAEIMTLVGDIASQSLDYIIMDESSMEYLSRGGWFGNVTDELNQEQIDLFRDKLYTVKTEEGESIPVAIDITDLPFVRDCALKVKKVYLVLPSNTKRAEKTDEFVDWLLAWPAET